MKRILITGATGNMGTEVIEHLCAMRQNLEVIAAVRDIDSAKKRFSDFPTLSFRTFDFEDVKTFKVAFQDVDVLFLLRPPHISEVEKYFSPLLESAKEQDIDKVVFLSVQGAEKSKVIPHNKIERLLSSLGFQYIFVRPSYFMQNLTTTLLPEIRAHHTITLPSGKAKFNWIDVKNIGEATAVLILHFETYKNQAFEITGSENLNFEEATAIITRVTGTTNIFQPINPISFYFRKKREGLQPGFAMVMTILHFLPRVQPEPEISENFKKLTGKRPTTLHEFVEREKEMFK